MAKFNAVRYSSKRQIVDSGDSNQGIAQKAFNFNNPSPHS